MQMLPIVLVCLASTGISRRTKTLSGKNRHSLAWSHESVQTPHGSALQQSLVDIEKASKQLLAFNPAGASKHWLYRHERKQSELFASWPPFSKHRLNLNLQSGHPRPGSGKKMPVAEPVVASDGVPPGFRTLLMPPRLASAALEEVKCALHDEKQWEMELQNSYRFARRGRWNPLPGSQHFPNCFELMRDVTQAFGIQWDADRAEHLQAIVRNYEPVGGTENMRPHVDDTVMFTDTVLGVVLCCDGEKDGLLLWPSGARLQDTEVFAVSECAGTAYCLQGPARYDFVHAVPPVTRKRVSVTWRWIKPEYYQSLLDSALRLELNDRHPGMQLPEPVNLTSTLDIERMSVADASLSAREVILHVSRSRWQEWVPLHFVKHGLEAKHGSFEVSNWGFPSFEAFLEHAVGKNNVNCNVEPMEVSLVADTGMDHKQS
mmetsp:Transcript_13777/g.26258  ORF Transcript_13777/g.26258 Transcript_13777/m.26258 type:complete len:432 (+) Transcript_13777:47-1342(+)